MWVEIIIRWFLIVLCCVAIVLHIIDIIHHIRTVRALDKMRDMYYKKYLELIEKEQGIELFDKNSEQ